MVTEPKTSFDVYSNARIKSYPSLDVIQVSNDTIFKQPGYECRSKERPYDVPSKGKAKDPEKSINSSRARARSAIYDIAMCNKFEVFFTWTLNKDVIDRYNSDLIKTKVQTFLKHKVQRNNFQYLCVGEYHKDGAIHFHGLCNLGSINIVPAFNQNNGEPIYTKHNQRVYNMVDWKFGYSSYVYVDENYERTCNYIMKYISKGSQKIFGKWYFSSRNLIKKPQIKIVHDINFDDFKSDNSDLFQIPVFRDVTIISKKISRDSVEVSTPVLSSGNAGSTPAPAPNEV